MPSAQSLSKFRDSFLAGFTKPSPLVAQFMIGLGATFIRPAIVATNKEEEPEKRMYSAARLFLQEVMVLPVYIVLGTIAGRAGRKFAKFSTNAENITSVLTTAILASINLVVPGATTMLIHKLPIEEKIAALAMKGDENPDTENKKHKLDVVSASPTFNTIKNPYLISPNFTNNFNLNELTRIKHNSILANMQI